MASIHTSAVHARISAIRTANPEIDGQAVTILVGSCGTLFLSRQESALLAADLLNAADATPADVEAAA